jgi:hypothetical protein
MVAEIVIKDMILLLKSAEEIKYSYLLNTIILDSHNKAFRK